MLGNDRFYICNYFGHTTITSPSIINAIYYIVYNQCLVDIPNIIAIIYLYIYAHFMAGVVFTF